MWIIRVIIILTVIWIVSLIVGWLIKRALLKKLQAFQKKYKETSDAQAPKSLVRCAECGTYIEADKAYHANQQSYCSKGHAQKKS